MKSDDALIAATCAHADEGPHADARARKTYAIFDVEHELVD